MLCSNCSYDSQNDAVFCAKCGKRLVEATPRISAVSLPTGPTVRNKGKGLSATSLILGILSIFPFSFVAGIPAVITGIISLAKRRPGKAMAIAGVVLGASTPITAGIILALMVPSFVKFQERARVSSVKSSMHVIQAALEAYAVDHQGFYPGPEVKWEYDNGQGMAAYILEDNFVGNNRSAVAGVYPLNAYLGERYRYGRDLFVMLDTLAVGQNAQVCASDQSCPYSRLSVPGDVPGTIVVLAHAELSPDGTKHVTQYGIAGFGRRTDEPLRDGDIYFVLHN